MPNKMPLAADRAALTNPSAVGGSGRLLRLITHILSADDFLKVAHQQLERTLGQGLRLLGNSRVYGVFKVPARPEAT